MFQARAEVFGPARLLLRHIGGIANQMDKALLLHNPIQLFGIVALAPVAHHDSGEVLGYEFPHLLVPMAGPNLENGKRGIDVPSETPSLLPRASRYHRYAPPPGPAPPSANAPIARPRRLRFAGSHPG
jgi:hypothetical protein